MIWKIYYHDKTTFSSEDGDWKDAPVRGVMGVAHLDDWVGYSCDFSKDFYILTPWSDDQPWGCDVWGLMDYLIEIEVMTEEDLLTDFSISKLANHGVKFGRSIPNDKWDEIKKWMTDDPDLPHKSGRYTYERP